MIKYDRAIQGTTTEYDTKLLRNEHYQKYPNMLPWVGNYYGRKYPRTIFIGESHYVPEESIVWKNVAKWYKSSQLSLDTNELEYIHTRGTIRDHHLTQGIWQRPGQIMFELGVKPLPKSTNVYEHFGYFNFFQRPAEYGKGIIQSAEDCDVANSVFRWNVTVLRPAVVIFLSKKAWDASDKELFSNAKIAFDYAPHPSSRRWNMKTPRYALKGSAPLTGSERFRRLVKLHLLGRQRGA